MIKKWIYSDDGKVSFTKVGITLLGLSMMITGAPEAAKLDNIVLTLPHWLVLAAFFMKYAGGIMAGIGGRDLVSKFLKR
ncbi:MAG: hypothetical protein PHN44_12465 [Candidatus Marinimicrobia bacterium]|nr:hypothetical protein [Candidatus Neomarinimicrobiota bacterium]